MRHIQLEIGTALLFTSPFFAQEGLDLSGAWRMDASLSESAHQAVPIGPVTLVSTQTARDLTIETRPGEKGTSVASTDKVI